LKFYLKIEKEMQNNLEKVRTYPIHSPKKSDTLSHHCHCRPCHCYEKFSSYTQNLIVTVPVANITVVLKVISYSFTISLLLFSQFRVLSFFFFQNYEMILLSLMSKILSNFEFEICYCGLSSSMPLQCECVYLWISVTYSI
jgi:hypothetical protein